ncbi:YihY family inner membrane protein [candidate division GN15 bacterium]|nr:YihY family inner membrane protein [candidate division GN15 bacterium]
MQVPRPIRILGEAIIKFFEDDVITLAASLAFFTALSLSPLLLILLSLASFLGDTAQAELIQQIELLIGSTARDTVQLVIENAREKQISGRISAIISLVALLFTATAMFAQLQKSLNKIWGVSSPDTAGIRTELWQWLRKRIVSLGMVVALGFLLLVSTAINATLTFVFQGAESYWGWVNFGASILVFTIMFGAIFRILPDTEVAWRDVWPGSIITAVLFALGKFLIGKYLGTSTVGSMYGAAGSLLVLLVWVYYSSLIAFFGAELTQVHATRLQNERKNNQSD